MPKVTLDEFAKQIWGKRTEGVPVPELDLKREITPQELENIYRKYAFVQILNPDAAGQFSDIKIIKSSSGWLILNYKNAMAASPGEMLFYQGDYVKTENGLDRVCSGIGTITLQIVNTAADMVRIAKEEEHWPRIHIVNGHASMSWGIWKAAQDLQISVTGYVPSKYEEAKYQRIQRECPALIMHEPPSAKR